MALRFAGARAGGTLPNVAALAILTAVLTACGAWVGTDLVFEHGFRVEPSRDTPAWNPSSVDILPGGNALYPDRWRWSRGRRAQASAGALPREEDAGAGTSGHGPADDALERLWQLDELRHEGVISQEDFERKKVDLLARI